MIKGLAIKDTFYAIKRMVRNAKKGIAGLAIGLLLVAASFMTPLPPATTHAQGIAPPSSCSRDDALRYYSAGITGGEGGTGFSDNPDPNFPPLRAYVDGVIIRSGDYVDSIQLVYLNPFLYGGRYGGDGGDRHVFDLRSGEYITGISGRSGSYIDSLIIHTNMRDSPRYGGGGGANYYSFDVPTGFHLIGLWGRSGAYVDAIGINYRRNC